MAIQVTPLLTRTCNELVRLGHAHTILLYGSRANGTEGTDSDYDIAAFGPVPALQRDARVVDGEFLDVFVYPEVVLTAPTEEHLRLRGSAILLQHNDSALRFLARLEVLYAQGPMPLPNDEIAARRTWAWKMSARFKRNDLEGNYRRVWLLTALLEDYFHIRGLWFEGPKRAFLWLSKHDRLAHQAFEAALQPNASREAIESLVAIVVDYAHTQPIT